MMGPQQTDQAALFYEFSLERHVPASHLLRAIDRFVDLSGVRSELAPFYSSTGRPSIDPELLVRMLLVGYCYGIRSERRLCEEVHLNLAYRWFCRLGLDGEVPDHSTFSKNRHGRFRDCDLLRKLFETVVRRCVSEGLVDGAAFAVDASLIAADANKQRSAAGAGQHDWEAIARTRRSVREYLDTLDDAAWGTASETVPKFISRSDPAAQWTGAHKGHAFFAYADNYLIDLKVAIIVDVEATRAIRQAEVGAARTMIDRTEERLGLRPERLAADSAYGSAEMLGWLVDERAIEPHIPVFDKSARKDGTFPRDDFAYDAETDIYRCPAGKVLASTGTLVNDGATLHYRASKYDCDICKLKPRCCPKMPSRKVPRSVYESARDVARGIARTEAYVTSRRERKKIEMLFAHLKRILRLDRLRLRGPYGAHDEFLLAATAQNLRRLAKLVPSPGPMPA
ncbi:IS1182 family transposase [Tardiphaga sp. vice154]|uniref:IS1182 family transposase n=1 Tax=Tardiphaga sp. vice154 TaxID=2592814 RepID=UPI00116342F0|nr:IS1182 family transposase [Tardiphaga sp. vice154]QDM22697.1 IS1182 family transposase [Tardiphaga sp. vice154]